MKLHLSVCFFLVLVVLSDLLVVLQVVQWLSTESKRKQDLYEERRAQFTETSAFAFNRASRHTALHVPVRWSNVA